MSRGALRWGVLAAWLLVGGNVAAQEVLDPVEQLAFDRPEAWAMAYFTSASVFTGLEPPVAKKPGSFDLGAELIWVPSLDAEQRRVGYGGFKEEDINRAPVWARLRLRVALPAGLGLELGWIPPVELDGVEADLRALALERSLFQRGPWSLGLRVHGQRGTAGGDFTCREGADHLFPPGSAENPFGCEAPSADRVRLDVWGGQLLLALQPRDGGPKVFAGLSYNHLDNVFQVDARTFGILDRTRLESDGETQTWQLGVAWPWQSLELSANAFYTRLDVLRPGQEKEQDPLFHLRLGVRYRLRG